MNTKKSLITITSLTATFVALCAAVFSVSGIAKLFAGASVSAAVMASALELGKIVSISFLYQYWKDIPRTLKYYLSTAALILMMVTSAGIYGYLSAAYAKVAATPLTLNAGIENTKVRITSVENDIDRKEKRLQQIFDLRSQQETRLDNVIGKSTTGNNTTIRTIQSVITQADKEVIVLQKDITNLSAQRDSLNAIAINKRVEIETNGDVGTFVYIAKILGTDLDTVVKWFTLVIVLVFDPLAVALVITVNFLLKHQSIQTSFTQKSFIEPLPVLDTGAVNKKRNRKKKVEAHNIYIPEVAEEPIEEKPVQEELPPPPQPRRDPQYFARGDFDWNNKSLWENDPIAKAYYNTFVAPLRRGS